MIDSVGTSSLTHRIRVAGRRALIRGYESGLQRRPTFRYLEQLDRSQWFPSDGIEELQTERLRELIAHAERFCPYYRRTWSELGLSSRRIDWVNAVRQWPVMSRLEINLHRTEMRSSQFANLISKSTGGSTGVPLHFFLNTDSVDRRMAAWHRGYAWAAAGVGTSQWYFWGIPLGERPLRARMKDRLYQGLYNRSVVSSFDYTDAKTEEVAASLRRQQPDAIVAYVNPLYEFARALEERGIRPFSPRSIVVGAEKLHAFQRDLITRVFRAPVFETYGSREFMLIGAECELQDGLHVTAEHLIVEVVDDHGVPCPDGVEGDIVVTDLFNYGMPFIRYRIGDRGLMSSAPCGCGRGLARISAVTGRKLDVIRTRDSRVVAGEFFPHFLKDFPVVRKFQVVQRSLDQVEVAVVTGDRLDSATRNKIETIIQRTLGDTCAVVLSEVDDIPLTAAGKHRVVVSSIAGS